MWRVVAERRRWRAASPSSRPMDRVTGARSGRRSPGRRTGSGHPTRRRSSMKLQRRRRRRPGAGQPDRRLVSAPPWTHGDASRTGSGSRPDTKRHLPYRGASVRRPGLRASRGTVCAGRAARGGAQSADHHPDPRQARSSARHGGPRDRDPQPRQGVPAVHRRPVGRRGVGGDARRREPGHGRGRRHRPGVERGGRRSGGRGRRDRLRVVVPDDAPDAQPRAAQDRRHPRRQRGRARAPRVQPDGQADRRRDRRDDDVVRPVPLLRRRVPGHGGPRGHRVPRGPHLDGPPRPGRRRRVDRAVELPAVHGGLEARARARDRQHRRPQAVRPDAALRAPVRRARRGRAARGRPQRPVGLRQRDRRPARRPPEGPDGLDHRRHRDRQAHRGDRGGHRQAPAPRAGRQGPGDRVRRRRRRARGRDHQVGRLLEQRPGLHRGLPRDRRPGRLRQVRRRPVGPGRSRSSGATRPTPTTSTWAR